MSSFVNLFLYYIYVYLFILNNNKYFYLFRLMLCPYARNEYQTSASHFVGHKNQERRRVTLRGFGVVTTGPRDCSSAASDLLQQLHEFA